MDIYKKIGVPATLEQCAEECVEFAKACLKMARKLREENPTPAGLGEIMSNLHEEAADVIVCTEAVIESGVLSRELVENEMRHKRARWEQRLGQMEEKQNV